MEYNVCMDGSELLLCIPLFAAASIVTFLSWLASASVVQKEKKNIFTRYLENATLSASVKPIGIIQKISYLFENSDIKKKPGYEFNKMATFIHLMWAAWSSCSLWSAVFSAIGFVLLTLILIASFFVN